MKSDADLHCAPCAGCGRRVTHIVAFVTADFALLAFDTPPVVRQRLADFGGVAAPSQAGWMAAAAAFVA